MNVYTKRKRTFFGYLKFFLYIFLFAIIIVGLVYLNSTLKVRNINITFFDDNPENQDIKSYTESYLREHANNFYNFFFLDQDVVTKKVHDYNEIVSKINISKSPSMDINVSVKKNEEFFYTCVPEEVGFLVRCMYGNTDGEFYKGLEYTDDFKNSSTTKLLIEINPKILYDIDTEKKVEEPDSLSGNRIYTLEDFKVLREMIKWVQKNGFQIKKVYADELKIVSIYTDDYEIIINLDKGYVDTVRDFELISRTGNLQKYINDDKEKIKYIDLSYKNKVFYKLKSADTNASSTTEFLDDTGTSTQATTSTTTINH